MGRAGRNAGKLPPGSGSRFGHAAERRDDAGDALSAGDGAAAQDLPAQPPASPAAAAADSGRASRCCAGRIHCWRSSRPHHRPGVGRRRGAVRLAGARGRVERDRGPGVGRHVLYAAAHGRVDHPQRADHAGGRGSKPGEALLHALRGSLSPLRRRFRSQHHLGHRARCRRKAAAPGAAATGTVLFTSDAINDYPRGTFDVELQRGILLPGEVSELPPHTGPALMMVTSGRLQATADGGQPAPISAGSGRLVTGALTLRNGDTQPAAFVVAALGEPVDGAEQPAAARSGRADAGARTTRADGSAAARGRGSHGAVDAHAGSRWSWNRRPYRPRRRRFLGERRHRWRRLERCRRGRRTDRIRSIATMTRMAPGRRGGLRLRHRPAQQRHRWRWSSRRRRSQSVRHKLGEH